MDDARAVVRAGYDEVAAAYLAARTREGGDIDALEDLLARLSPAARVLDAGCGAGVPVATRLVAGGFVTCGLDLSIGQLHLGNEHVTGWRPVQGDLTVLPFRDGAFDALLSFYAVIHVPRALHPTIFEEVHRVLRPGGLALLCLGAADLPEADDADSWLGTRMYWSHYDAPTNLRLLRDAGFTIDDDREVPDPMGHRGHLFARVRRADA
jgi:SAM-dependent methyltransferase